MEAPRSAPLMPSGTDSYLARVSQFVPVETLALYLIFENLLDLSGMAQGAADATATAKLTSLPTLVFACSWGTTPLYVWAQGWVAGAPSIARALVSGLA